MTITLERNVFGDLYTFGRVKINEIAISLSLEDALRSVKVPKQTCIPFGKYPTIWDYSPKFNRHLAELTGVPNFSETKFHAGNEVAHTDGCPLLGMRRNGEKIAESRMAMDVFHALVEPAFKRGEKVVTEVTLAPDYVMEARNPERISDIMAVITSLRLKDMPHV